MKKPTLITRVAIPTKIIFGVAGALASFGVAQAQITFSSGGSLTAWNGSPAYVSLANSSLSGATTAQGDPAITGTYGLMAETFTPSSSFTLGSFALLLGVNNVSTATYTISLYNLGPAGAVSVSGASASYNPFTPSPSSLTSAFSDTVTFSAASSGEVQGTFSLPTADQVILSANEEYALEIWTPAGDGQNAITWYRSSTADPGGQMFSNGDAANSAGSGTRLTLSGSGQAGGAPRTGSLALYAVPEPSTLALLCLGLLSAVSLRRRTV